MPLAITADDLDSAIAFPFFPFRDGAVDLAGLRRNTRYVVECCALTSGRRVVATGGGSLLHHLSPKDQLEAARAVGEEAGDRAWFISGILPTPVREARHLVRRQIQLPRPPDAFLLLPPVGGYNPEGVLRELGSLCRELGRDGLRLALYLRDPALRDACCRLVESYDSLLGIKIGTSVEDAAAVRGRLGAQRAVVWGIGDLSTEAALAGARGHTSGISTLCARASDQLHDAQRAGNFDAARRIEEELRPLESIRFLQSRAYNYSAVWEALRIAQFPDVESGDGGPFNAPPPPAITEQIRTAVGRLRQYH